MIKFSIIPISLSFLFSGVFAYAGMPPSEKYVEYRSPTWLSNEEIVFIKKVTYDKSNYGLNPLTNFIKGLGNTPEYRTVRRDYCICSMKTDGTGERIIKQFAIIYDKDENVIKRVRVEGKKEIPVEEEIRPYVMDCSAKRGLIAFSSDGMYGIYIMKTDGADLEKISEKGTNPRLSLDGSKILYRDEDGLYIMNSDGSNKYKLVDGNVSAVWHPDGKRIFFDYREDYYIYVINTDGTDKKKFIETGTSPEDWSPDGSKLIAGGMFTADGKNILRDWLASKNPPKYHIPDNARFSPDGTKIVGESIYEPQGEIAILDTDFTNIKVLRKNERYPSREDKK